MAISLANNQKTPSRVFIKSCNTETDWKELVGSIVRDSITVSDCVTEPYRPTTLRFTATINISRKNKIKLLKEVGIMKKPRCTYKTIRRDCAKRNK